MLRFITCLIPLCLSALTATAGAPSESLRWTIERLGIHFELTKSDLRAWKGTAPDTHILSAQDILAMGKRRFDDGTEESAHELLGEDPPSYGSYTASQYLSLEPLSVVGPIVSYLETNAGYFPGAAHPYAYRVITTQNVSADGAEASLLDFYPEQRIVGALKADPWIRKFKVDEDSLALADTVAKLAKALNEARYNSADTASCAMDAYFDESLVTHFAFYDRMGTEVVVRIAIPYAAEICRGTMHQIGLLLPVPAGIAEELTKAERLQEGFLMKDREKLGKPAYSATWEVDLRELAKKMHSYPPPQ